MTVWLMLRRGRWLSQVLGAFLSPKGRLFKMLRKLGSPTWMTCALLFTTACRGDAHCPFCAKSLSRAEDVAQRGYHLITLDVDVNDGVQVIVDDPFTTKPECFMLIELPAISNAMALDFFYRMSELRYNAMGYIFNFLVWPVGRSYGIQADNNTSQTKAVFCSEAVCAFLQSSGYPMGLTPCRTTPHMLAAALVSRYPDLAVRQFQFDPTVPAHARLEQRLVKVQTELHFTFN
jgi:hypothetical protein